MISLHYNLHHFSNTMHHFFHCWPIYSVMRQNLNGFPFILSIPVRNLPIHHVIFKVYHSSVRVAMEQSFKMLINRFGIIWSVIRFGPDSISKIVKVSMKLHNFTTDSNDTLSNKDLSQHEQNNVQSTPEVHV